ncbi:MAG: hypothetical protein Q4C59_09540, partial [Lachnospiraceae bacterium]|nr:hypothetical protein [Lachnospiraceae bacterium]
MKIKVVLISTVVTAGLVGGIGYGAYRVMKGKAEPVDVVPVSNVNNAYYGYGFGDNSTLSGVVTSQVAQTVMLDEEYEISEIYVEAGDEVKEGTPLFAYDMTLPELELEMEQLNLQTLELEKTSLEKDIDKLKKTPATASLESNGGTMTASGEEDSIILDEAAPGGESGASGQSSGEQGDTPASAPAAGGSGNTLGILGIEEVGDPQLEEADGPSDAEAKENGQADQEKGLLDGGETEEDETQTDENAGESEPLTDENVGGSDPQTLEKLEDDNGNSEGITLDKINAFTEVMNKLSVVYDSNGGDVTSAESISNLEEALGYRKLLADFQANGSWALKDEVKELLGEEPANQESVLLGEMDKLSQYHAAYVSELISDLNRDVEDFANKTDAARKAYTALNEKERVLVQNVSLLTDAEQYLRDQEEKAALTSAINEFNNLIQNLEVFYEKYKDENLTAQNIEGAVKTASGFYREKLADRMEDGSYVIKPKVQSLLGEEEATSVQTMAEQLEQYEVLYVELLIQELNETSGDLQNQAEKARAEYENLSKNAKDKVSAGSIEKLERIETALKETETPTEAETETETP